MAEKRIKAVEPQEKPRSSKMGAANEIRRGRADGAHADALTLNG
jgi:hypothetical protein